MLKKLLLPLVALGALVWAVGFLLPGDWSSERSVVIAAQRPAIYAQVATLRTWSEWTAWTLEEDPTLEWQYEGPATGLGAAMTWWGDDVGEGSLDITAADPETGIGYDLHMGPGAPAISGEIRLEPADGGTRVTWSCAGDVDGQPLEKLFAGLGLVGRRVGADHEAGLRRLKSRIEDGG